MNKNRVTTLMVLAVSVVAPSASHGQFWKKAVETVGGVISAGAQVAALPVTTVVQTIKTVTSGQNVSTVADPFRSAAG